MRRIHSYITRLLMPSPPEIGIVHPVQLASKGGNKGKRKSMIPNWNNRLGGWFLGTVSLLCIAPEAALSAADLRFAGIFADHAVLQRDVVAPVWGWGEPGEQVTVSFATQTKTATADAEGKWMVRLDPARYDTQVNPGDDPSFPEAISTSDRPPFIQLLTPTRHE